MVENTVNDMTARAIARVAVASAMADVLRKFGQFPQQQHQIVTDAYTAAHALKMGNSEIDEAIDKHVRDIAFKATSGL